MKFIKSILVCLSISVNFITAVKIDVEFEYNNLNAAAEFKKTIFLEFENNQIYQESYQIYQTDLFQIKFDLDKPDPNTNDPILYISVTERDTTQKPIITDRLSVILGNYLVRSYKCYVNGIATQNILSSKAKLKLKFYKD